MRGRVVLGVGDGPGLTPRIQGYKGGYEKVTLTTPYIPAHNHSLGAVSGAGNTGTPTGSALASTGSIPASIPINVPVTGNVATGIPVTVGSKTSPQTGATTAEGTFTGAVAVGSASTNIAVGVYSSSDPDTSMNEGSIGNTGGNQSHENMTPYLVLSYHIAMVGLFPSRN